jgi:acyl carrier protein
VQEIIAGVLGTSIESISADATATDLPGWDSIRHLVLVMEVERAFGFQFGLDEISELTSIRTIVAAVDQRVPS